MDIFGPPQSTYLNGTTRVIRTPPAPQGGGMYPCNLQSKPQKESEMYPQCRHVRMDSDRCHAAAIKGDHWCFFHARLHDQQAQRVARETQRRSRDARSQLRLTDGTFAPTEETTEGIFDQGIYPVQAGDHREPATLNSHGSAYAETV